MPQHFNFPEHLLAPHATKGESLDLTQDQGVLRLNTRLGAVIFIPLELQKVLPVARYGKIIPEFSSVVCENGSRGMNLDRRNTGRDRRDTQGMVV